MAGVGLLSRPKIGCFQPQFLIGKGLLKIFAVDVGLGITLHLPFKPPIPSVMRVTESKGVIAHIQGIVHGDGATLCSKMLLVGHPQTQCKSGPLLTVLFGPPVTSRSPEYELGHARQRGDDIGVDLIGHGPFENIETCGPHELLHLLR